MEIRLGSQVRDAKEAEGTAIIIDVFRAFTTAAIAFDHGVREITLVAEAEDALALHRRGVGDFLMGEVAGKRPEGFDFGNSPYEISQADLEGKTLVQSTRAGTVGVAAASKADTIYLGSLVVAQATVNAILRDNPALVSIIAMGDQGTVRSDEDEHCGIYLRNLLEGRHPDPAAMQSLIMQGGATQKFFDDTQPQFHPKDVELALQVNKYPFAMKVNREDGQLVARKVVAGQLVARGGSTDVIPEIGRCGSWQSRKPSLCGYYLLKNGAGCGLMRLNDVKKALAAHETELKDQGVKSLAIFGSVARGDAGPNSDVDLLIEFDRTVGLFHFIHVKDFLGGLLEGAHVDLVMREAVYEELKEDIYGEAVNVL